MYIGTYEAVQGQHWTAEHIFTYVITYSTKHWWEKILADPEAKILFHLDFVQALAIAK